MGPFLRTAGAASPGSQDGFGGAAKGITKIPLLRTGCQTYPCRQALGIPNWRYRQLSRGTLHAVVNGCQAVRANGVQLAISPVQIDRGRNGGKN
jgi:hypothetical protein